MNVEIQPALLRERFYPRSRQTVRTAREFAAETLHAWGVTCRQDDVSLCVSELATNALLHGVPPGRGYRLRMLRFEGVVRVEVHDSGGGRPRIGRRDPGAEGGRGLLLVAAIADRWGILARVPGKVVWCEFAVGAGEAGGTVGAGGAGEPGGAGRTGGTVGAGGPSDGL
ncbi:ATP-binding protein [Streptomyces sp. NRRL S-378]|uniref:ATP-binding protein n=1 Tax=Streptomyces sp. NRRL S-378 TaxID=1463904 RepID=UPI00099D1728|nr:ATP-binding protein [Streptomyces sp. NRRL S-378]